MTEKPYDFVDREADASLEEKSSPFSIEAARERLRAVVEYFR